MKKNLLIRILSIVCVLACLFAFASCHDDLATKEELGTVDNNLTEVSGKLDKLTATVNEKADQAVIAEQLKEVSDKLKSVEATADAAATLEALQAVIADLEAVETIAKAAAVDAEVDAAIAEINALIAQAATKAELDALKTELKNADETNVEAINAKIAELATKTELEEVKTALETVKGTADAAVTEEALNKALNDLKLDDKINAAKTEINGKITALEEKLAADIKKNADEITAIKNDIANIKIQVGDTAAIDALVARVTALEEKLNGIDVDGFKKEYGALTDKLLDPDYEYAYSKFVEIVLDIDEGPYDPDEAKSVRLQAEDILFSVTRAISEDGLKALYEELVTIKTNLKTLEESLTEKVDAITYINTSAECIELVKAADKLYEKMIDLEIEFVNPDLKAKYERIWNAFIELNGGLTKDETTNHTGLKNTAKADIEDVIAKLLNRDVKLGSNDKDTIDDYQAAIAALKTAIDNSAYRDLYEAGLAEGVIDAVKAEVIAEKTAEVKAELTATKRDEYKAVYEAAYIVEFIGYTLGEDNVTKTPVENGAWYNEIINLIAADLKVAHPELSDDDAKAQAVEAYANDATAYATIADTAYATVNAQASAKVAEDAVKNELYAKADAQIAEEAAQAANDYVATDAGNKVVFVRAMAESLYNEDAAEAIAQRYENMVVGAVKTIINNWDSTGLLWNDATVAEAFNNIKAWVENANYKSANEAYIAAYGFADDNVSDENRDYVFGTYTGAVTNYAQLTNVMGYVAALNDIYNTYNFVAKNGDVEVYNVSGVASLINEIKKAVNGVDVEGTIVLDVDNIAVDLVKASINELNEKLGVAANNNSVATKLNYEAMIPAIVLNRIAVIENAESKLAAIVTELKAKYYNEEKGEWEVDEINAADVIEAFEKRIADEYALVQADSKAPDYVIHNVTSSITEAAIDGAYASFEKFTEFAGEQYLKAKALIEKLEALGEVKLNHGKEIYEVALGLKSLSVVIDGMTYETRFPVKNETTGEYEMVDFYVLQEKINNKFVPEYAALAANAVAKADALKAEIDALVASIGDKANKLDNFNAIVELMTKVKVEWLDAFYSDDMLAVDDADKYTKAANALAAIKAAVEATTDTKIIGKVGATYVFLSNETYKSLEDITKTAIATYRAVEKLAENWIKDAEAIVNGGDYTFHDWDKEGNNFKNIEERYQKIVADYYIITALAIDTDPDFGLYEAHETFIVEYNKCKDAYEKSAAEIKKIEDAINALGAYTTITLDNTVERRAALQAIYDAIANFEANFCGLAQEDGDIDADLLFYLAKYNGLVEIAEDWVSKQAQWPSTWNAVESFNVAIEAIDNSIATAVEFGKDKYDALENFVNGEKSVDDKEIENATTVTP